MERGVVTAELIARARAGDETAFGALVEPYRRELNVHCYRILGSIQDAEDALQETLVTAWRSLATFEERASIRTWLYRVATSRCLNALRSARRRPDTVMPTLPVEPPEPTRLGEVAWLEPYPDVLLDNLFDRGPSPEAIYDTREAISLAFITALQLLPPRQRVVLVLRDVLGYHANEVAKMIGASQDSVTSALKRARATLKRHLATSSNREPPPPPRSATEHDVIDRLTHAFENSNVDALVALLTEDVWVTMPPLPLEYQGRAVVGRFLSTVAFRSERAWRAVPTRANGQPAFGTYVRELHAPVFHANGIWVLTLAGDQICAITRFDNTTLPRFGLPRILPA